MKYTGRIEIKAVRTLCPKGTKVSVVKMSTDEDFSFNVSHENVDSLKEVVSTFKALGFSSSQVEIRGSRWDWYYLVTMTPNGGQRKWPVE